MVSDLTPKFLLQFELIFMYRVTVVCFHSFTKWLSSFSQHNLNEDNFLALVHTLGFSVRTDSKSDLRIYLGELRSRRLSSY